MKSFKNHLLESQEKLKVSGRITSKYYPLLVQWDLTFDFFEGSFWCDSLELTKLKNCPIEIEGKFNCSDNKLKNLKGSPIFFSGNFSCDTNELESLEGCPEEIKAGNFDCSYNKLKSLNHCPKKVGMDFSCGDNALKELHSYPEKVIVGRNFYMSSNEGKVWTEEEIREKFEVAGKVFLEDTW